MLHRIAGFGMMLSICMSSMVHAEATPDQAKALLAETVTYYQANGAEKTFSEINNHDGMFRKGELYIFVYDGDAHIVAHGGDLGLIGTDIKEVKDVNGFYFGREIMTIEDTGGSVDYLWMNPASGSVEAKTSYITHIDEFRFGCGIYK
jgi:cytochrome c